jgi:hypothetical protein
MLGSRLGSISGVTVGKGDILYLGRNGYGEIVKITKAGDYLGIFASPSGRDEDLECDLISFAPKEVLWSKDAYGDYADAIEVEVGTCVCGGVGILEIPFDIHPAGCPNPINRISLGVTPTAIMGTEDFDITQVDLNTVTLMGVSPVRWANEDVGTPFEPYIGKEDCGMDCNTYGMDGYLDLTLKFDTPTLVAALEDAFGPLNRDDCLVLSITGLLLDGTEFVGEDVVIIK